MPSATRDATTPRVFVIDDDQALCNMLELSMSSDGLRVATARDGVDALEELGRAE